MSRGKWKREEEVIIPVKEEEKKETKDNSILEAIIVAGFIARGCSIDSSVMTASKKIVKDILNGK